ncbi:MAG: hypothetical protein J7621_23395 [Niastella sp.]|nr:hypothetical protein [Niastella sp.]
MTRKKNESSWYVIRQFLFQIDSYALISPIKTVSNSLKNPPQNYIAAFRREIKNSREYIRINRF